MSIGRISLMLLLLSSGIIAYSPIVAQTSSANYIIQDLSIRNRLNKIGFSSFHQGKMVYQFYDDNQLKWYSSPANIIVRNSLLNLIKNADLYALVPASYHYANLTDNQTLHNREDTIDAELFYADAALSFMHDLAYGGDYNFVRYNAIKYHPDNLDLIATLKEALNSKNFIGTVTRVEPAGDKYNCLKQEYLRMLNVYKKDSFKDVVITSKKISASNINLVTKLRQLGYLSDTDTTEQGLKVAFRKFQQQYSILLQPSITTNCLNILNEPIDHKLEELTWNIRWYRWLNLMKDKQFVAINIPANRLAFFDSSQVKLESKMVVGKTSTPTPTLISEIKNVIYYPYWNIPFSIATKEILPILKKRPGYLQVLKLEVLKNGTLHLLILL
jgi:murein L,D-transpeptidase YcbB/YkuD